MRNKLLINKRIAALREIMEVDEETYKFLCESTDTLFRLYEYYLKTLQKSCHFTTDESLFHLVIYMNGREIYSIDYSTEVFYDVTDEFLESGEVARFTEVQVNNKLFAFMKGNDILIECIPRDNIPLLNEIQSTPGWIKLSGGQANS